MLVREDYEKIEEWLKNKAIKDTQFSKVTTFTDKDLIPFVQDGKNKNISILALKEHIKDAVLDSVDLTNETEIMKDTGFLLSAQPGSKGNGKLPYIYHENDDHTYLINYRFYNGTTYEQKTLIPIVSESQSGFMTPGKLSNLNEVYTWYEETVPSNPLGQTTITQSSTQCDIRIDVMNLRTGKPISDALSYTIKAASEKSAGVMTAEDKQKLDSIDPDNMGNDITYTINGVKITEKTELWGEQINLGTPTVQGKDAFNVTNFSPDIQDTIANNIAYLYSAVHLLRGATINGTSIKGADQDTPSTITLAGNNLIVTGYKALPDGMHYSEMDAPIKGTDTINEAFRKLEYRVRELEKKVDNLTQTE